MKLSGTLIEVDQNTTNFIIVHWVILAEMTEKEIQVVIYNNYKLKHTQFNFFLTSFSQLTLMVQLHFCLVIIWVQYILVTVRRNTKALMQKEAKFCNLMVIVIQFFQNKWGQDFFIKTRILHRKFHKTNKFHVTAV